MVFPSGLHPLEQATNVRVLEAAHRLGIELYLVGGYLRDALMGRLKADGNKRDFDYAVAGAPAARFARSIADEFAGHFVLLDEENDTARVVLEAGTNLDFAGCVGGDINSDVLRRDFTINALAWDPAKPDEILDLVGGVADISSRTVRAIAEGNFIDDPLRMLRAFRFAATIGGTIDPSTLAMIKQHSERLEAIAAERVCYELFIIMESPAAGVTLKELGEAGLLEAIFPELTATRKVTPNAYHHLGLWDHSLESVSQAEERLTNLPDWVQENLRGEVSAGVTRLGATKLACLLHDVGKPGTWAITPEGRHTFYGHDRLGAEIAEQTSTRLKWSRPLDRFVVKLIRWHLRPGQLFHQGDPTDRAVHRFYRTIGEDVPALIVLAFGDLGATRGEGMLGDSRVSLENNLFELLQGFPEFLKGERSRVRLLDGHQIMLLLGIKPGPVLGELIEALHEAQGINEISTRAQAEKFIVDLYEQTDRG